MAGRSEHTTRRPSVRFEAPIGGSRHHRNDSGVGSLSDYDTHDIDPDRSERRRSTPSPAALQLALDREREERLNAIDDLAATLKEMEKWKKKAADADSMRINFQKELAETKALLASAQANAQALKNRTDILEQENRDLQKDVEKLAARSKKHDKHSDDSPSPPPIMRGGGAAEPEKMKRRMSKSHKGTEAEREKEKLRGRFERSDQSDTSNSTGKSSTARRRRESTSCYIEPMGPSAQRPPVPMPPSPTRHYSAYSTTPQQPPQFTNMQPPVVTQVPRSAPKPTTVHPKVTYTYEEAAAGFPNREDGTYHNYPLPRERR